jgi:hypothetical protein
VGYDGHTAGRCDEFVGRNVIELPKGGDRCRESADRRRHERDDAEDRISILPGQIRINGLVSSKFLGGVSVAAAIAAAALRHRAPDVAFAFWLVAIVVPLLALPRGEGRTGGWWAAAGVLAIAAFFRLHAIDRLPYGYWIDEAATVLGSVTNAARGFDPFGWTPLLPWRPDWVQTSNLYLGFAYLCFAIGGVKLISVLPALITPIIVVRMARSMVSMPYALLAGGTFAASLWDVTLSRWGWNEVLATMLITSAFALLLRKSPRAIFAAGVLCGLAQYTYPSSRVAIVIALIVLAGKRRVFFLGFLAAAAPLLADVATSPSMFTRRAAETWAPASAIAGNAAKYALMFNVRGDHNPRHNFPDRPELELIPGLLFLAGVAVLLRERRTDRAKLLLAWLGIGLLIGILTMPAPNAYRVGFIAPACFLIAAVGAERLAAIARLLENRAIAVVVLIIAISAITTYRVYVIERDRCRICWLSNREGALARFTANAAHEVRGKTVFFDAIMERPEWELERMTGVAARWIDPRKTPIDFTHAVLFTVPPGNPSFPRNIDPRSAVVLRNELGDPIVSRIGN